MKICFIADGRNAIAKNWIRYFLSEGHEAHLISTFPCDAAEPPVTSLTVIPLDFSARARAINLGGGGGLNDVGSPLLSRFRGGSVWRIMATVRNQLNPAAVVFKKQSVRAAVDAIAPDIVHAMRIPFEGILAAHALEGSQYPLLISVWGNDFTLFAENSRVTSLMTKRAMHRTDALHPDCERDLTLAAGYGFDRRKPAAVLPGNGGVRTNIFFAGKSGNEVRSQFDIPQDAPVVINPRGVKPYIRTSEFFRAIPLVLNEMPNVFFLGGMMQGNAVADNWVRKLGIQRSMRCLPYVHHDRMADIFRTATITVSPADHDGTPNSLLEAMACGTFPVAGDIEPVREWIVHERNGLLFDQRDHKSIASAILLALKNEALRKSAFGINQKLVLSRASYDKVMPQAVQFYESIIASNKARRTI